DALEAVEANNLPLARTDVARARAADPLSTTPLYAGAAIEDRTGNDAGARRLYEEAVRKEPASSESWLRLAQFELDRGDPRAALRAIGPALYLDSRSQAVQLMWLEASRAEAQRRADAERARGEEAQVVGAWVEVRLQRAGAQCEQRRRDAAVVGRRDEQPPAPAQD